MYILKRERNWRERERSVVYSRRDTEENRIRESKGNVAGECQQVKFSLTWDR